MASGRLADYLGIGDEADIPVSLDLSAGAVGFFYAKDSNKLFAWDGAQWVLVLAGGVPAAEDVTYDNVSSGLSATDVQEAIDELAAGGGGDVTGPASSTAGNFALFSDGTGKEIEDGGTPGEMAFVDDAPIDGQEYVRKDGDWAVASGGGVPEAPIDGKIYGRKDADWEEISGGGGSSDIIDVESPSNVAGTVTLDFDSKSRYVGAITLSANVTTLAFSNLPGAGKYAEYELHIAQDGTGSRTFAIPASHKALGGSDTAIASAANAVTVLTASTVDNGTTWRYAMQESA